MPLCVSPLSFACFCFFSEIFFFPDEGLHLSFALKKNREYPLRISHFQTGEEGKWLGGTLEEDNEEEEGEITSINEGQGSSRSFVVELLCGVG